MTQAGGFDPSPLTQAALSLGARRAAIVRVSDIAFDRRFRALCESNACGNYGRSWMCPPDVGEIDALIAAAQTYAHALVYQSVGTLADSFDFEGMMAAAARHNALAQRLSEVFPAYRFPRARHRGAGGCRLCPACAKRTGEPCRHPARALASLEAYGVDVSALARLAGMPYINGKDTVTSFGAYLYCPPEN